MRTIKNLLLSLLLAPLILAGAVALLFAGAGIYDNLMRDDYYFHSGSCPEFPSCYADEEGVGYEF